MQDFDFATYYQRWQRCLIYWGLKDYIKMLIQNEQNYVTIQPKKDLNCLPEQAMFFCFGLNYFLNESRVCQWV